MFLLLLFRILKALCSCFSLSEIVFHQDTFGVSLVLQQSSLHFTHCSHFHPTPFLRFLPLVNSIEEEHICRPKNLSHVYLFIHLFLLLFILFIYCLGLLVIQFQACSFCPFLMPLFITFKESISTFHLWHHPNNSYLLLTFSNPKQLIHLSPHLSPFLSYILPTHDSLINFFFFFIFFIFFYSLHNPFLFFSLFLLSFLFSLSIHNIAPRVIADDNQSPPIANFHFSSLSFSIIFSLFISFFLALSSLTPISSTVHRYHASFYLRRRRQPPFPLSLPMATDIPLLHLFTILGDRQVFVLFYFISTVFIYGFWLEFRLLGLMFGAFILFGLC